MRATVYIGTSVDGFIARENGDIEWLTSRGDPMAGSGEDYGYREFFDSVDALVMGRGTYDLVRTFQPWPYADKPVIVLTTRRLDIPPQLAGTVEVMQGPPTGIYQRLAERGYRHIYVDGGKTIQGFLAAGLIHRIIMTQVPVLIGSGIPLFGPLPHDIPLVHVATRTYANGLVQTEYDVSTEA